jgi:hypothetical protein
MGKDREAVFRKLESRNIARVEVFYGGGDDEGGVHDILLYDAKGNKVGQMQEFYGNYKTWNNKTNTWDEPEPPTEEQLLSKSLCKPVYEVYDTFAGEYYVDGVMTWDVAKRKVTNSGSERSESWDSFSSEV